MRKDNSLPWWKALPLLALFPLVMVCLVVVIVSIFAGYVPKPLADWVNELQQAS